MKLTNWFIAISISSLFLGCKQDDEIGPNDKNTLVLKFENKIDNNSLVLGSKTYKNASGEDFSVTTLNYFVSNIVLQKSDGSNLKIADQYYLVKESDEASRSISLNDIPAGDYKNLTFTIGVDSLKSIADISLRTGVLDPASYGSDNMYWSWNSGYIFFKIEGISDVVPANTAGLNKYEYHIGGFGGKTTQTPSNLQTISLPFNVNAKVRKATSPEVHVFFDVKKVFDGPNAIQLKMVKSAHAPAAGKPIAANYVKGFFVDDVHNE